MRFSVSRIVFLAIAVLGGFAALAASADFTPPLGGRAKSLDGKWRVLDVDSRHTTSTCIGSRRTPQCAIETAMACYLHADFELCKASYVPYYPTIFLRPKGETDFRNTYRFDRREPLGEERYQFHLEYPQPLSRPLLRSDEIVMSRQRLCWTRDERRECFGRAVKMVWYIRLTEDGWRVVMERSIRE